MAVDPTESPPGAEPAEARSWVGGMASMGCLQASEVDVTGTRGGRGDYLGIYAVFALVDALVLNQQLYLPSVAR